jgi:hypothetical protein
VVQCCRCCCCCCFGGWFYLVELNRYATVNLNCFVRSPECTRINDNRKSGPQYRKTTSYSQRASRFFVSTAAHSNHWEQLGFWRFRIDAAFIRCIDSICSRIHSIWSSAKWQRPLFRSGIIGSGIVPSYGINACFRSTSCIIGIK